MRVCVYIAIYIYIYIIHILYRDRMRGKKRTINYFFFDILNYIETFTNIELNYLYCTKH